MSVGEGADVYFEFGGVEFVIGDFASVVVEHLGAGAPAWHFNGGAVRDGDVEQAACWVWREGEGQGSNSWDGLCYRFKICLEVGVLCNGYGAGVVDVAIVPA